LYTLGRIKKNLGTSEKKESYICRAGFPQERKNEGEKRGKENNHISVRKDSGSGRSERTNV